MNHSASKMLLAFLFLFGFSSMAINPNQVRSVKLSISDPVVIKVNGNLRQGKGLTVPMILEKETDVITIYSDNEMTVTAEYKLVVYHNNRSESKNGGMKLHIHYKVKYGKAQRSTHVDHVFINTDEKSFNEKVNFNIANGLNNIKLQITYKGTLSN